MTIEKWEQIKQMLESNFSILESYQVEDKENSAIVDTVEFIHTSGEKLKAEFSQTTIRLKRSTEEPEGFLKLSRWQEGNETWRFVKPEELSF